MLSTAHFNANAIIIVLVHYDRRLIAVILIEVYQRWTCNSAPIYALIKQVPHHRPMMTTTRSQRVPTYLFSMIPPSVSSPLHDKNTFPKEG
jgi:hypothetical protein